MVGTSGSIGVRFAVLTPNARALPAFRCCIAVGRLGIASAVSPDNKAIMPGPEPL